MSAEDAIARAKAIAARLAGTGATASLSATSASDPRTAAAAPVTNGDVNAVAEAALSAAFGGGGGASSGNKRKRWGTESSGENPASAVSDALAAALSTPAKRPSTGTSYESSQKIYIPVDQNPGYNYIGLLIGPGGSKQRELVAQSGGNVKISIRGKGSSSTNAIPGRPEEPLHVALEGSTASVEKAAALVNELLNDSTKAQAEKEKQLAVVAGNKNDAGSAGGGSSSTPYQPKPVAQLLGLNSNPYGPPSDATHVVEEKIGVPNGVVGYIIGKGGESITSMQRKSGCRVQIQKEFEMEAGTTQRIITLIGATQESVSQCRGIIEDMVKERLRLNDEQGGGGRSFGGGGPGTNAAGQAAQLQTALAEGHHHVVVRAPNNDVGLIIGKGGMTIRSIQERSGANVQIPQGADADNPTVRTINITHPSKEGAEFAKTLIEEVLNSKVNQGYGGGGNVGSSPNDVSVQIQIPDKDVGMCIGKAGCVIREMQQRTQTRIQIPSMPTPGQMNRIATVSGSAEGCAKVQEIINRIIVEQSSQFVMTGQAFQANGGGQYAYGQYGQQQYGAAAGQQQDYSAQWAAYFASQAGAQNGTTAAAAAPTTADATQTAAAATAAATTGTDASASANPAPDAYYDAFFRYSYHYGEEAARKYYGAWSPPEGTANPYGNNPALSSNGGGESASASTQPAASQPATATSSSDHSQVKDSSRRNVSNLPAWMTKG